MTATIWDSIETALRHDLAPARPALARLDPAGEPTDRQLLDAYRRGMIPAATLLALRHLATLRVVSRSAHIQRWEYEYSTPALRELQAQLTMLAFYDVLATAEGDDLTALIYWRTLHLLRCPRRKRRVDEVHIDVRDLHTARSPQPLVDRYTDHDGPQLNRLTRVRNQLLSQSYEPDAPDITTTELTAWARHRDERTRQDLRLLGLKYAQATVRSTRELALEMGLSEDALETRLRRARRRLRRALTAPGTGLAAVPTTSAA